MGEVLPQGNPPKSLRGQPRTPVRPRAHEKTQCWNAQHRTRTRDNPKQPLLGAFVGLWGGMVRTTYY